jgi:GT2 family glycosyltransferase
MKPPKCSIVIPVHDGAELTAQCLEALWRNTPDDAVEVIVVDNASTDETGRLLASFGSRLRTLRHETNLGFAAACNRGARESRNEIVVFLNNDTVVQPSWLMHLAGFLSGRERAAVAGSLLLDADGKTISHAGLAIRYDDIPVTLYRGFPLLPGIGDRRRRVQAVSGACMAVKREAFLALDGFDRAYTNGYEDVDFCLRTQQKGWETWYVPESRVIHLEGQTSGRFDREAENARLFVERWAGRMPRDAVRLLEEDGFEVINPKARSLLLRDGRLFSIRGGRLHAVTLLPTRPLARAAWRLLLKARHARARVRYGRRYEPGAHASSASIPSVDVRR